MDVEEYKAFLKSKHMPKGACNNSVVIDANRYLDEAKAETDAKATIKKKTPKPSAKRRTNTIKESNPMRQNEEKQELKSEYSANYHTIKPEEKRPPTISNMRPFVNIGF
jgi:hypothetical protein